MTDFKLIRARRRSVGLRLLPDGALQVRAPRWLPLFAIQAVVRSKWTWVERKRRELKALPSPQNPTLTQAEMDATKIKAAEYFKQRCAYFAPLMGVQPKSIRVSSARTRWGSCSSQGNISLNWKLMQATPDAIDYVVVHELAHLRHMNHSRDFWRCVQQVLSGYRQQIAWLRSHQWLLQA